MPQKRKTLDYVFMLRGEERWAVLVLVHEMFEKVEIDFEDGSPTTMLSRRQLATPGIDVDVPNDARKLHVQMLRASAKGVRGPLLMWLGKERLTAFLADEDAEPRPQLAVTQDADAYRKADGSLDEAKMKRDAEIVGDLVERIIKKGWAPGEAE